MREEEDRYTADMPNRSSYKKMTTLLDNDAIFSPMRLFNVCGQFFSQPKLNSLLIIHSAVDQAEKCIFSLKSDFGI